MSDTITPPWINGNRAASIPPTETATYRAPDPNKLLTSQETAELLGIRNNSLEIWRFKSKGPRFIKLGPTAQSPVRYRLGDVLEWIEQHSAGSTSEYSANALRSINGGGR